MSADGSPLARSLHAGPEAAGARLDAWLASQLGVPRAQARRLLARGAVRVDGRRVFEAAKGMALEPGQRIEVGPFTPADELTPPPAPDMPLHVLAEGPGWIAVHKPAGVAVHPLQEEQRRTLLNALAARVPGIAGVGEGGLRSGVVHRLDVDTSGALLFATREDAWRRLRAAFREHRMEKVYRAIVLGDAGPGGPVELGLVMAQHRPARVRILPVSRVGHAPGARLGVLHWRPLERLRGATLVEVRPRTGFLHQIRATLAHLGFPVAGDATYGPGPQADPSGARRQMLHAASLAFEEVTAHSPDAEDFRSLLDSLRRGV